MKTFWSSSRRTVCARKYHVCLFHIRACNRTCTHMHVRARASIFARYSPVHVCHAHVHVRPTRLAVQLSVIHAKASRALSCKRVTHGVRTHVCVYGIRTVYHMPRHAHVHICIYSRIHVRAMHTTMSCNTRGELDVVCGVESAVRDGRR